MAELYPYHAIVGTNIWDGPIRKWRKINLSKARFSGCSILKLLTIVLLFCFFKNVTGD